MLLLLQTRQHMTTAELSERLEVSRRTVLRDVEALSAAGVPVYAERGRHGGIVLLPGARLNASHLEPRELEALSVSGLDDGQLESLGLAAVHEAASRKIAARQATAAQASAARSAAPGAADQARLADMIHVDGSAWLSEPKAEVDVADLALALRHRRRLRIRYRRSAEVRSSTLTIDPYVLVATSGRWYLVADERGAGRLFTLERLSAYEQLDAPAGLRTGETLRAVWAELKERTETQGRVSVTAHLRGSRLDLTRRILGTRIHEVSDTDTEWCTLIVRYPDIESVRQLLQFGDHIEVISPAAARERVRLLAADMAERHSPASDGM